MIMSLKWNLILPGNNNIHAVVLARSNDKKTLDDRHQPSKYLNQPIKARSTSYTRACEHATNWHATYAKSNAHLTSTTVYKDISIPF
jgi:hypothetical protein